MLRGFGAAPYPANLGILVSTAWVRMTARGFECLIKCLAQPQVIVSALTSGCLKVIQQTLVNLMQPSVPMGSALSVLNTEGDSVPSQCCLNGTREEPFTQRFH